MAKIENGMTIEERDGKPIIVVNYYDFVNKKEYRWEFKELTIGDYCNRKIIKSEEMTGGQIINPVRSLLNDMMIDGLQFTDAIPMRILDKVREYLKDFL
jgi:hypothetical protein